MFDMCFDHSFHAFSLRSPISSSFQGSLERNLTNTAWALAVLGFRHKQLMEVVASEVQRKQLQLIPQALRVQCVTYRCISQSYLDIYSIQSAPRTNILYI